MKCIRNGLILLICLLNTGMILSGQNNRQWVPLEGHEAARTGEPQLTTVRADDSKLDVRLNVRGFFLSQYRQNGVTYDSLEIGKTNGDLPPGSPNLPAVRQYIYIPAGKKARLKITKGKPTTFENYRVNPVQQPQADVLTDELKVDAFFVDNAVYKSNRIYPSQMVFLDPVKNLRGHQVAMLHMCPFQYNPARQTLEVYGQMEVSIVFEGEARKVDQRLQAGVFDKYVTGFVLNPKALSDYKAVQSDNIEAGAELLIITAPEFLSAAASLKTHKDSMGLSTMVVTTETTGTTNTDIKSYIQNAYDTWSPAPSYLLLLGDAESIPTNYESIHPYHGFHSGTDLYYTTLAGDDYEPDIFQGRISVNTLAEAEIVCNKIIAYESNPPTESWFYANAIMAAYFQDHNGDGFADRRFARTSEEVRDFLLKEGYNAERVYYTPASTTPTNYNNRQFGSGESVAPELLRTSGFAWDGDAWDINEKLNRGAFLLMHRDHGGDRNFGNAHTGWGDPEYHEGHIALLNNGNQLPVVFSINCLTGWFDAETDEVGTGYESFCELFLRKEAGGAVGVIGATRVSYSGYNDYLAEGFIDCVWPDFLPSVPNNSGASSRLGPMLNHGKVAMSLLWRGSGQVHQVEYEIFHVIGDPSMRMWTKQPDSQGTQTVVVRSAPDLLVPMVVNTGGPDLNYTTYFTRTYSHGSTVTITAPETHNGDTFNKWIVDGNFVTDRSIQLTMDQYHEVTAAYLPASGNKKIMVYNRDENSDSPTALLEAIQACNRDTEVVAGLPSYIDPEYYPAVFVCLGMYWDNYKLAPAEGEILKNYLDNGGNLYMEGGNTWGEDIEVAVHPYFGISGVSTGSNDAGTLIGVPGVFTSGYSLVYGGDNNSVDRLEKAAGADGAFVIWNNLSPAFSFGIARDAGTYRTIGVSFEFAGLPAAARTEVMRLYLNFLSPRAMLTVSGRITLNGAPMEGVTLEGLLTNPVTDASGAYSVSVHEGWSGTVTPVLSGYGFTPAQTVYPGLTANQTADYTGRMVPVVSVLSPNGGEVWEAGTRRTIGWATNALAGDVNLEYSTTGPDGPFTEIVSGLANSGNYQWSVPDVDSSSCRIRITTTAGTASDVSDGVFTIIPLPRITIISPNGNQQLEIGGWFNVQWKAVNLTGEVNIDLYKGTTRFCNVGRANAASIYGWSIPSYLPESDNYRVRIYQDDVEDYSDRYFSIKNKRSYVMYGNDYNGDGKADIAIFRPSTGRWCIKGIPSQRWGAPGDIPVPGDYDGDGTTDIAIFRPSIGRWCIKGIPSQRWGASGDIPVPGDYNGDGTTDMVIYRPSTGRWCIKGRSSVAWGAPGDIPIPGDYNGNGVTDFAIYRPSNSRWCVNRQPSIAFGKPGDIPVPADYDGDGTTDIAVFRPSNGRWYIMGETSQAWGTDIDIPVPADYNGDGIDDIAIYRPMYGLWAIKGVPSQRYGAPGDVPLVSHKGK
ncbi:MAG: hypothetical protein GY765_35305 [bacterium]|nr:hypothetical protein [bacterium]